jgi:translation initiation factor IF-3
MIRMTPIRVIGADGEQVGVIETPVALRMAEAAGLDLVEISPDARPPVCKIMDFGKFKYETSKNESKNKSKASELKEIRLGRSVKIDPHDVGIRINQARKFLLDGHKVQVTQRFKGREMAHRELGIAHLRQFRDELADIAKCETEPRFMGAQASIILAPDKPKCEAYKQKHQKALKAAKAADARAEKAEKAEKDRREGKIPAAPTSGPAPADDHDEDTGLQQPPDAPDTDLENDDGDDDDKN